MIESWNMATTWLKTTSGCVQTLSVVAGVVISVLSFNAARQQEAIARHAEAAKPFLEMRQQRYLEAVHAAAVLSNPDDHSDEEKDVAAKRFRELYVAELSLVEGREVEGAMVRLAELVDPNVVQFTPARRAAYDLAHALRDSLVKSWHVGSDVVDNR